MEPNETLETLFDVLRSALQWEAITPVVQVAEAGPEVYLYCEFPAARLPAPLETPNSACDGEAAPARGDPRSLLQLLVGDGPSTPCTALFPPSLPGEQSLVLSLWMARMADPELLTTNLHHNFDYALRGNTLLIRSDATAAPLETPNSTAQTHPNLARIATAEVSFGRRGAPSEFRLIYALHRRAPELTVPTPPPPHTLIPGGTQSTQALEELMLQRHLEQFRRKNKDSAVAKPKNSKKVHSAVARPQPERLTPEEVQCCKIAADKALGVRLLAISVEEADALDNADTANDAEMFGIAEGGRPEPRRFRADLRAFLAAKKRKYRVRTVSGAPLNLFKLMYSVLSRGGIAEVIHEKHFKKVTKELGLGATCTSGAFVLRTEYLDLLHDYEQELALGRTLNYPGTPAPKPPPALMPSSKLNTPIGPSPHASLITSLPVSSPFGKNDPGFSALQQNFLKTPPTSFPGLFGLAAGTPPIQPYSELRHVFGNEEPVSFGLLDRLDIPEDDKNVQDENDPPKEHYLDSHPSLPKESPS